MLIEELYQTLEVTPYPKRATMISPGQKGLSISLIVNLGLSIL